jgi:hypothetical protein
VGASIVLGVWLPELAVHPISEGILAIIAAVLVTSMVVHVLKTAKRGRAAGQQFQSAVEHSGPGAWVVTLLFILLMIAREGIEFAYVSAALARNPQGGPMIAVGLLGLLAAGGLAAACAGYGRRMDAPLFFQVSSIFFVLFALHLMLYAFHEFTRANAVPLIDNARWHTATEAWAEGKYAQALHLVLVLAPLAWLCYATYGGSARAAKAAVSSKGSAISLAMIAVALVYLVGPSE